MCLSKCSYVCVFVVCIVYVIYVAVFNNKHDERIYIPRRMPSHDVCVCACFVLQSVYMCLSKCSYVCVFVVCILYITLLFF